MSECITLVKGDYICVIPKGATNGEVIKALFPNIDVRLFTDANIVQVKILNLDSYWWNAPYKKGGE